MLGKISAGDGGPFDPGLVLDISLGTMYPDLGYKLARKRHWFDSVRISKGGIFDQGRYCYDTSIANNWFYRATKHDYEVEIRYVQFLMTGPGRKGHCYYYQAGSSSGRSGQYTWRYPPQQ